MLKTPKIVYYCNHIINNVVSENVIDTITRSSEQEDIIIDRGSIKTINSLYTVIEDNFTFYYEGTHFNRLSQSIEWANGPLAGQKYNIEYIKVTRDVNEYDQENCPRCSGNGWYVSLFSENKSSTQVYTGTHKLIQEFIKTLLTTKTSTYGTSLVEVTALNLLDKNLISAEVMSAVYDAESQIKAMQDSDIFAGSLSSPEERLASADVADLEVDQSGAGIYLKILLSNEAGNASEINLLI